MCAMSHDNLRRSLELRAQRITSEILQHCGTNNLTMSKFTERMTAHTERFATARTQFGEVSDVQIQRFEDDFRMAEGDDGYMLGSDMSFWQRDRLECTTFRQWSNADKTKSGLNIQFTTAVNTSIMLQVVLHFRRLIQAFPGK